MNILIKALVVIVVLIRDGIRARKGGYRPGTVARSGSMIIKSTDPSWERSLWAFLGHPLPETARERVVKWWGYLCGRDPEPEQPTYEDFLYGSSRTLGGHGTLWKDGVQIGEVTDVDVRITPAPIPWDC
jgi:hypothetical protein